VVKGGDEACLTCHVEKRGPFVYEHDIVTGSGAEACLTCHQAHGSPHPKLQKMRGRGLCLQCHTDIAQDDVHRRLSGDCWRSGCHPAFHGSNRSRSFLG
jgi:predicted CXXCH cytochrome family protein